MERSAGRKNYRSYAQEAEVIRLPFIKQSLSVVILLMIVTGLDALPVREVREALSIVNGYLEYQLPLRRVYASIDRIVLKAKQELAGRSEKWGIEIPFLSETHQEEEIQTEAIPVFAMNEGHAEFFKAPKEQEEPVSFAVPLSGPVTSGYGERINPATGKESFHHGVDIGGALNSEIQCACSGTVTKTGFDDINGNYVMVSHKKAYETLYAHLKSIHVAEGQELNAGEVIGIMGNTGLTVGTGHLHFEVHQNGQSLDPESFISFQ